MDTDFGMGKSLTYLLTHSLIDLSTGQGMSSFSSFSSSSSSFGGSGKSGKSVSTSTYIGPDGRKVTKKSTTIYKPDGSQVQLLTRAYLLTHSRALTHSLPTLLQETHSEEFTEDAPVGSRIGNGSSKSGKSNGLLSYGKR